ncbi:hypothetical protein DICPUDRAFT_83142 [Dictyostelium purpureum]|uniref:Uncharacterized protein n=1 Tax=Dictyostelium purpureum TaxID=5786 RepID=F0ZYN4_DICPU|nr:uncharacterized protein DICPUDRAFT_83142 [Dictyostelium purpureum]EGC30953.1 hypothetical protein DICPUDRAFT_83142 [Dictyostelium purpureum]|eukprot:XP_003292530.1 hypothetical protein DICPUDRAFT_83142 [Dictyostelium purpureum]
MKLLLLLIITILFNCAKSQNCFVQTGFSGATLEFISSDTNSNIRNDNGVFGYTGVTNGTLSVDIENGIVFVDSSELSVSFTGTYQSSSQIYGFEGTSTLFIINEGTCYKSALSFVIPINQIPQINKIGTNTIGTLECGVYEVVNQENQDITSITVLVNEQDCSLVSGNSVNNNGNPGSSLINFYNYVPKANPSYFNLPSICNNAQPLPTSNQNHMNTISHSLSLLNYLK